MAVASPWTLNQQPTPSICPPLLYVAWDVCVSRVHCLPSSLLPSIPYFALLVIISSCSSLSFVFPLFFRKPTATYTRQSEREIARNYETDMSAHSVQGCYTNLSENVGACAYDKGELAVASNAPLQSIGLSPLLVAPTHSLASIELGPEEASANWHSASVDRYVSVVYALPRSPCLAPHREGTINNFTRAHTNKHTHTHTFFSYTRVYTALC